MDSKKGFLLYPNYKEQIDLLTVEQKAELLDAIFDYQNGLDVGELTAVTRMAFSFIKAQFDRDNDAWETTKQKRSEAGKVSAKHRATKSTSVESVKQNPTKSTSVKSVESKSTNPTVNVNVNVNEDVNVGSNEPNKRVCEHFPNDPELDEAFVNLLATRDKVNDGVITQTKQKIFELAGKDTKKATKIINQSLAQGWSGLFPLNEDKPKKPPATKQANFTERPTDENALNRELFGRRTG